MNAQNKVKVECIPVQYLREDNGDVPLLIRVTAGDLRRIEAAMRRRGWTRNQLAGETGLDNATIYRLLGRRTRAMKPESLRVIYHNLDLSEDLIGQLDADERRWMDAYDRIARGLPAQIPEWLSKVEAWARAAELAADADDGDPRPPRGRALTPPTARK